MIEKILKKVKSHKKYKNIADKIVLDEIKKYLKSNPISREDASKKTLGVLDKQTIKGIRANLHKTYSSFQTKNKAKANIYLEELKKTKTKKQLFETTDKLLSLTLSTKERLNDYSKIYRQIFKITGEPRKIIDLGAGLNPFSYPYMGLKKLTYYSYDINTEDIKFLNKYFKLIPDLNGKAEIFDVKNARVSKLPKADVVLMFKLIDILDIKDHKPSEQLITNLFKQNKTKFIVASFATRTLTRRKMNYPKRKWFELMLSRNNLKFFKFQTDNEVFYVVWK